MKRFQPYLPILWTLVLNLVQLIWQVGRQIVLPGRKKTGNLLTSLFQLFAGLVEQLIGCRREVKCVPVDLTIKIPEWRLCKGWVRRGVLIAAWALFILASFEYGGGQTRESSVDHPAETAFIAAAARETMLPESDRPAFYPAVPEEVFERPLSVKPPIERWLLLRTLRI